MKHFSWLSFLLILILAFTGCVPVSPTIQPTQVELLPTATNPEVAPTSTSTQTVTEIPSPTTTLTPLATLSPESAKATMEPMLADPIQCAGTCFLGITPGRTSMEETKAFFSPMGFEHLEGIDLNDPNSGRNFYSVEYESDQGRSFHVTFWSSNHLVESIQITPIIAEQKEGSPRDWIAYSPETLIQKFGQPSRVEFGLAFQQNVTINMILYFDEIDLIALYAGIGDPDHFCPLTFPFYFVRLLMGPNPPYPPLFPTVPLEESTSLTVDQFTQLMLRDPQTACFTVNWEVFVDQ